MSCIEIEITHIFEVNNTLVKLFAVADPKTLYIATMRIIILIINHV